VESRSAIIAKSKDPLVEVTHIPADRREEWNQFVAQEPSFGLLQSWEWGEFKQKLGWKAYRIAVKKQGQIVAGAQMLIKSMPLVMASVAYVPRGPIGEWLEDGITSQILCEMHRVARNHRAIFLRIEPPLLNDPVTCQRLQHHHFRASPCTNQPPATIIMDLTQDLDKVLAQMHHKTRYNIRYATKKGVTVRLGGLEDLAAFYQLIKTTGRRAGFTPRTLYYYRCQWEMFADLGQMRLFLASYQGKIIAANMCVRFGEHAVFLNGASSGEHKNVMPNHLLMWEAIQWAKTQKCRTFDLWGIPDEVGQMACEGKEPPVTDRKDGLWGVYRFKRGFSKNVVFYTGAHDYVYSPLLYALTTNKFVSGRMLDRIAVWMDSLRLFS